MQQSEYEETALVSIGVPVIISAMMILAILCYRETMLATHNSGSRVYLPLALDPGRSATKTQG